MLIYMGVSLLLAMIAAVIFVCSSAWLHEDTVKDYLRYNDYFDVPEDGEELFLAIITIMFMLTMGLFAGALAFAVSILYAIGVWVIKRVNK